MNVEKIEIKADEEHPSFFRGVLFSMPSFCGRTSFEILCSPETLRQIRNACNQALEEREITKSEEESIFRSGKLKNFGK